MTSWKNDNFMKLQESRENNSDEDDNGNPDKTDESQDVFETNENYDDGDEDQWTVAEENLFTLDNICGLAHVKETLFNVFIYPAIFPRFFPGNIRWNQILLYGPPGTGKTMLAKAMATEINATLRRVTTSDLLSHWQGQTEKQIKALFHEIRSSGEITLLFFDEIDGLCRKRTSAEDDSTRRIKTELLTQLDDFASASDNHRTFILGATNCPWEIDSGFMRRFHKKIFIPLPDKEARLEIMKRSFDHVETDLTDAEWKEVVDITEGYSGSDLVNVVMTSCCERFIQTKNCKYWEAKGGFWVPAHPRSLFPAKMNFGDIHPDQIGAQSVTLSDVKVAIESTPKTVSQEDILKYLEFSEKNQIK